MGNLSKVRQRMNQNDACGLGACKPNGLLKRSFGVGGEIHCDQDSFVSLLIFHFTFFVEWCLRIKPCQQSLWEWGLQVVRLHAVNTATASVEHFIRSVTTEQSLDTVSANRYIHNIIGSLPFG